MMEGRSEWHPELACGNGEVGKWYTVSVKVTDEQIAALNLRLQQLGFATMGDYARALTEGVVGNRQLVEDLAEHWLPRLLSK
jgi:hypothetical protein